VVGGGGGGLGGLCLRGGGGGVGEGPGGGGCWGAGGGEVKPHKAFLLGGWLWRGGGGGLLAFNWWVFSSGREPTKIRAPLPCVVLRKIEKRLKRWQTKRIIRQAHTQQKTSGTLKGEKKKKPPFALEREGTKGLLREESTRTRNIWGQNSLVLRTCFHKRKGSLEKRKKNT